LAGKVRGGRVMVNTLEHNEFGVSKCSSHRISWSNHVAVTDHHKRGNSDFAKFTQGWHFGKALDVSLNCSAIVTRCFQELHNKIRKFEVVSGGCVRPHAITNAKQDDLAKGSWICQRSAQHQSCTSAKPNRINGFTLTHHINQTLHGFSFAPWRMSVYTSGTVQKVRMAELGGSDPNRKMFAGLDEETEKAIEVNYEALSKTQEYWNSTYSTWTDFNFGLNTMLDGLRTHLPR